MTQAEACKQSVPLRMDMPSPIGIVQRYSQLTKIPIIESYDIDTHMYSIILGCMSVSVVVTTTKQAAKAEACQKLIEQGGDILQIGTAARKSWKEIYESMPGVDYLKYSRATVLQGCRIHINDPSFFNMDMKVVSFDSEGRPLRLAQLCCSMTDVYMFDLPLYYNQVRRVLTNPRIKKIVCDRKSEEVSFGIEIHNYIDVQDGQDRKSLAKLIEAHTGVAVKKNRVIHMNGWKSNLTKDQIDYAAADALWTLLVANHQNATGVQ